MIVLDVLIFDALPGHPRLRMTLTTRGIFWDLLPALPIPPTASRMRARVAA